MIVRTYGCPGCGHVMEVRLTAEQWDDPDPVCPKCAGATEQEFKPTAITGSPRARAVAIAEDIAEKDYGVADMKVEGREGEKPKVRYKENQTFAPSTWGTDRAAIDRALTAGRQTRLQFGNGLDVLQANLKSGAQPDLIAASKKRAMKVW